jgi:putative glutamine amidotransferase
VVSNGSEVTPRPLVGFSVYVEMASHGPWAEESALLPYSYLSALGRAGGTPVLLPPAPGEEDRLLDLLDGMVLTGGPDVDPGLYGAERHSLTDRPRPQRDQWELALCRAALARPVPLLAICRGLQVLNVAAGGTLHQHLPDVVGHEEHRVKPGQTSPVRVGLAEGTRVASILGPGADGLCHHHQAIDRLGGDLRAVGFAADGTIEAVERPGPAFAVGVQWHPEDNPADDRLFRALVTEAAAYHRRKGGGAG